MDEFLVSDLQYLIYITTYTLDFSSTRVTCIFGSTSTQEMGDDIIRAGDYFNSSVYHRGKISYGI
jgi:hypothetical protein